MKGRLLGGLVVGAVWLWPMAAHGGGPGLEDEDLGARAPAATLRDEILAGEREQQRIAQAGAAVAGRILDLLKTMRANRAADAETLGRWDHAVRELTALSREDMARAAAALRTAARTDEAKVRDALRAASLEQREILSRLLALLKAIEQRLAYARLVETVEQLVQDQARTRAETVAAARETLGKLASQLTEPERQRTGDLSDEQEALRTTYERLAEDVENLVKPEASPAASAPRTPSADADRLPALKQAAERMRADRADRDMRQASAALAERDPVAAATAQARALAKLEQLRDLLRSDDSARLKQLDAAAAELDRLLTAQRAAKDQTSRLTPAAQPQAVQAARKTQAGVTHDTAQLADRTRTLVPKAADALQAAAANQRQADARMAANDPAPAAREQQAAIDRMEAAKQALDDERRQLAQRPTEPSRVERLERAAADLGQAVQGQEKALQKSQQMADQAAEGRPPDPQQLNQAAQEQRALEQAVRNVARDLQRQAGTDTARALNAALKDQDAAAQDLENQRPQDAAADQQKALDQLNQAAGNLNYQLQLARQKQTRDAALAQVEAQERAAVDAFDQAARKLSDLDQLTARQQDVRDRTQALGERMGAKPPAAPPAPEESRKQAGALADQQRDLQNQTGQLGDLLRPLDRDVAKALAAATPPQKAAAEHLDRSAPAPAAQEQDRALARLADARKHLGKKLEDIVDLLKTLDAKRQDLAREAGENQPETAPPQPPGPGEPAVDDLLKLAGALVDVNKLRDQQGQTRTATAAESQRARDPKAKPNPQTLGQLAGRQDEHGQDAQELGQRMDGWDPEGRLGVAQVQSAVREAAQSMQRAAQDLKQAQPAPAVGNQTQALDHLQTAFAAVTRAFESAAHEVQQQLQVAQQQRATDPREYDPMSRPPGQLGPEDLARLRLWNVNLPPRVRDEIIAVLSDRFPAGYEELLRRYYQDLSQEAWDRLDLRNPVRKEPR
jgi:hypothetical protein